MCSEISKLYLYLIVGRGGSGRRRMGGGGGGGGLCSGDAITIQP